MKPIERFRQFRLPRALAISAPDAELQVYRIRFMERNVGLPIKWVIIVALFYYLFVSKWFDEGTTPAISSYRLGSRMVAPHARTCWNVFRGSSSFTWY